MLLLELEQGSIVFSKRSEQSEGAVIYLAGRLKYMRAMVANVGKVVTEFCLLS